MTNQQDTHSSKNNLYLWQGTDRQGRKLKGRIRALSTDLAKAQLRREGISVSIISKKTSAGFGLGEKKITLREITLLTRQLSTMLRAGVPLIPCLNILSEGLDNRSMQQMILSIRNDIAAGNMFSTSLRKHPRYFDTLFCNLVEAGERSGSLEQMLDRIAQHKEKTNRIRNKIKQALYYPIAVLTIAISVMLILLLKVVPQFQSLFDSFNAELPLITRLVITMSEEVQQGWWFITSLLVALPLITILIYRKSESFATGMDSYVIKLPLLGALIRQSSIARITRTLSTSFAAGVPLVEAMTSAAATADNRYFTQAVLKARDHVATGQQLNAALKTTQVFPPLVTQMISVGEASGALDTMLEKIADVYEEEVNNAVESAITLLEPIMIAVLGILVGGLVLAIYLPVFEMGSLF